MKISVKDIAGANCITLGDGQTLFSEIVPALKSGNTVELDFAGVRVFASPFFNAAIGQLLREFNVETLNEKLKVSNLPPNGIETFKKVVENSRDFYKSERLRNAVSATLSEADDNSDDAEKP